MLALFTFTLIHSLCFAEDPEAVPGAQLRGSRAGTEVEWHDMYTRGQDSAHQEEHREKDCCPPPAQHQASKKCFPACDSCQTCMGGVCMGAPCDSCNNMCDSCQTCHFGFCTGFTCSFKCLMCYDDPLMCPPGTTFMSGGCINGKCMPGSCV